MVDELMTVESVSRYLKVTPKTLSNWRSSGVGPDFMRLAGRVLYPLSRVLAWEERRTVRGTVRSGREVR